METYLNTILSASFILHAGGRHYRPRHSHLIELFTLWWRNWSRESHSKIIIKAWNPRLLSSSLPSEPPCQNNNLKDDFLNRSLLLSFTRPLGHFPADNSICKPIQSPLKHGSSWTRASAGMGREDSAFFGGWRVLNSLKDLAEQSCWFRMAREQSFWLSSGFSLFVEWLNIGSTEIQYQQFYWI